MLDAFIDTYGGAETLAGLLGIPVGTVRVWKTRKSIPRARWPDLLEKVPGVTLEALKRTEAGPQS